GNCGRLGETDAHGPDPGDGRGRRLCHLPGLGAGVRHHRNRAAHRRRAHFAMSVTMTAGEQALAIEAIKRVFAARLRALDEKRWDIYPTLHTDDVVSETWAGLPADKQPRTGGTSNRVVGREA